jgi:hypothetical protein
MQIYEISYNNDIKSCHFLLKMLEFVQINKVYVHFCAFFQ